MIIHEGVSLQDISHLVVWPTDGGDTMAMRGWGLSESLAFTYRHFVEVATVGGSENAEIEATLSVTKALENSLKFIRIGFASTSDIRKVITIELARAEQRLMADE